MSNPGHAHRKPIVLITGISGNVGSSLSKSLSCDYHVVGMDLSEPSDGGDWIKIDLTSDSSVAQAMREFRDRFDDHIASVVHLAAYFDFTGERKALYEQVNVEGTRRLLRALHGLKVEQFVCCGSSSLAIPMMAMPARAMPSLMVRGAKQGKEKLGSSVNYPWNLLACIAIGLWLMTTRLTVGAEGSMANADHLIGSLVITVAVTALAEVARPVRLLNVLFGVALLITPFVYDATVLSLWSSLICGLALIGLSLRHGPVRLRYGDWDRWLI
jgi:hypothetical protein